MKKIKSFKNHIILIISLFLVILCVILLFSYKRSISKPLKGNEGVISVEVRHGEGIYSVLDRLNRENKLSNKYFIKLNLMFNKKDMSLQEGIYEVNSNVNLPELINTLNNQEDNKNVKKLVIPEGYTIDQISSKVEEEGICSKEDFINAVKNYKLPNFIKEDSNKRYSLEGFLYPDTYFIKNGSNAEAVVNLMFNRFMEVLVEIENEYGIDIKDNEIEKTITIASMIEKEARYDYDRDLISSVVYNRLKDNMKLQLDATVIYGLGYHVDVVLNKHLEVNSLYNTYKYAGLPIGPIGSPGKASIRAALFPKETNYLFYILKEDGYHYFTDSYDDFLKKKEELGY
ncbi:endolytic transglycosylase MltG [Clostridium botulinum]|uniref:endolytic transglycosylase MltG n=1 Tax=unclassified Clostridium TaxID=2614128 RepID=UPI0005025B98|nr:MULTISPECIES: endolytic transglycosylase MltG [unclassified Clostridium]AIY81874.1 yceG-like family protein [Clostridium botulinum 202F]KAI3348532.1 endolytic transglycosylase MltG [Clostridium botulinum]KFX58214.1 aminodeoxychorismate lyase [Clostridium botulinum]KFX59107.1 aminodeoxychorismate lyase [Clostridium botulinum]KON12647.1 aminodeoxychorismate lyase [Clostridium botulinum]